MSGGPARPVRPSAGWPDSAQADADRALAQLAGPGATRRLFVPGRIEVLGKHTDYAGGRSVTCAAERGFAVAWRPRGDARLRVVDAGDGRRADFPIAATIQPPVGHWTNYPMTVARRLARNFGALDRGADVAFCNTLPRSAGLSTSSALVAAIFLVLAEANELAGRAGFAAAIPDGCGLAGYLGAIENGRPFGPLDGDAGVGTSGGSEDHTAILLGKPGHLCCYSYHPVVRHRAVALDPGLVFVVAASGIAASKTGAARGRYNRAADLVAEIVAVAEEGSQAQAGREGAPVPGRTRQPTLADIIDASPGALAGLRARLPAARSRFAPAELARRLEHFVIEDRRILPPALEALARGRLQTFGRLVDRSQRAAEDLLGNQVPETITLARLARQLGAHAASSFGAGFGGSVWALTGAADAAGFADRWMEAYAGRHPAAAARATAFVTRPGAGALHAAWAGRA